MRVFLASPLSPSQIGGPTQYVREIKNEFLKKGIEVAVVTYGSVERMLPPIVRHVVYFFRALPEGIRADVVIAFDTWSVGIPALLLARLLGKKSIVRISGDFLWESYIERTKESVRLSAFYDSPKILTLKERIIRAGTAYLLRHADALLFTTAWLKDIWERTYAFPREKSFILENFFPPHEEAPAPSKRSFIFAGRNIHLKNGEALARVFSRVRARHPDIELDTRQLPQKEHLERVKRSYAVLVPSLSEVNPNAVIDAVRFSKPFLTTVDTGIRQRIEGTGLFVDTLNEAEIERGIETLLDPEQYREIERRVRRFSYTHSFKEIADEILAAAHTL